MLFDKIPSVLERARAALAFKNKVMERPQTETGGEIHDPTPAAPPLGFRRSLSVEERIIQAMRQERMAVLAEQAGQETIADFNDFGDDDDHYDEVFPTSRFEGAILDAKRMGKDYKLSKKERDAQEAAEDRFAEKLASRIRGDEFEEETPAPQVGRKSPSGARRRVAPEGRQDGQQTPAIKDPED